MTSLLAPESIAIVGASDDPAKPAARPLRFLREGGYGGKIYPVARRETVMGMQAWPSLDALPSRPDHAFVLLPTEAAMSAVADCVRLEIPVVTVLAGGFAEDGPKGVAREAALRRMLAGSRTRLLGPNSIGLVNVHARMTLTANAAFAEPGIPPGGLFVASQSGSMIGAILSRGRARGLGFAGLVSVGSEVDLDCGTICAATLDDPDVTAYLLFLETLRGAASLRRFAFEAAKREKPVIAYKLGRSAEAAELAQSHTGALAGEDDIADAFFRDCGIARVLTLDGLLEAAALLHQLPIRPRCARKPAIGVITTTGGGAAMVVDQLGLRGISAQPPSAATAVLLATAGASPGAQPARILDLTMAGARPEVMGGALRVLLDAPEFDLVVAVIGSSARLQPEIAVQPVVEAARNGGRLAAFCAPEAPRAWAMLAEAGVAVFRTPEACADAVAAAFSRLPPRAAASAGPFIAESRSLDEAEAYGVLARIGVAHAPFVALAADEVAAAVLPFAAPFVVKILHRDIPHKSDVGGVMLGVTAQALAEAARRIVADVARHVPTAAPRILIQPMIKALGEVLIGFQIDPQAGPVVLLAAGGLLTELYRDRSVRMAPIDLATAFEMIGDVVALRALEGFRGRPRGDMQALAEALVALSRLAVDPVIVAYEVNPLMVLAEGQGVVAVDAVAWSR